MNYPTREEFEQLKEEVRKLKEQQTEPIKITRLEIDSGSMHKQLGSVQEDTNILKIEMAGARADILKIRESQADQRDTLKEHGQCLSVIEAKQDAHTEILDKLVDFAESHDTTLKDHTKRFDQIEATQAEHSTILKEHSTILKEHSTILKEHSTILKEHSTILKEHSTILREILALLKQRPGE